MSVKRDHIWMSNSFLQLKVNSIFDGVIQLISLLKRQ